MKKLFLALLIFPSLAFCQPGKTELSLSLNTVDPFLPLGNIHFEDKYLDGGDYANKSMALGLTWKYFMNEGNAIRVRFVYTVRNIRDSRDITTGQHLITDYKFRQPLVKFSPGFQWTFTEGKFLFLGGMELPVTIIGEMKVNSYTLSDSLNGVSRNEYWTLQKIPGGTSVGLGVFLGSNYFFTERFGIGFEFGMAYQYSSVGGTLVLETSSEGTSGSSTTLEQHNETIRQMKFSTIQAAINLAVRF